jgi:PBSX family phage terminase large subunit
MARHIKWTPSQRQLEAFSYLTDHKTTEVFYGGGAGGGKSYLGCVWLIYCCLAYPGTRYLMGRAILKTLKESTLLTFFRICKDFGLKKDTDFKYNSIEGRITLTNGSEIFLKDLFLYPSDPEFDSLGSTEYTGAFVDEVSEITEKAKNIVMSRLRYKLDEFKIIPKLLLASNPSKNFAYREYWKPWMENRLPEYRKFIPALVGDNPHISKFYAENLKKLDENSKQRLLFGNWNYDDDPTRLFDYSKIMAIFENEYSARTKDEKYLSVDVARFGSDKTVIVQWHGFNITNIKVYEKKSTKEIREILESISYYEHIPKFNIIIDEDGIGGGIVDEMKGVRGFINNATPIELKQPPTSYTKPPKHNFANLKSQCYFYLANLMNEGKITCFKEINPEIKDFLIADLQQIKVKNIEKDGKIAVTPKDEIKESLGRSPDFSDAVMMRIFFELKGEYKPFLSGLPKRYI